MYVYNVSIYEDFFHLICVFVHYRVVPNTIHAAFMKASSYFKIKLITIPIDPVTLKVDVKKMERAITKNTVMVMYRINTID
jgi:glutamate/tyrosine decarboxylase-like PLP-dependent enzyme